MNKVIEFIKKYYIAFLIIVLSFVLDRITKEIVYANETSIEVIKNFFYLDLVMNPGAAFSTFTNAKTFLIIITIFAIGFFIFFLKDATFKKGTFFYSLGFSLMFGGCLGNFYDRLVYGEVIDFLSFKLNLPFMVYFPTFNIADSCMVVGVISLIVYLLFFSDELKIFSKKKKASELSEENSTDDIKEE